MQEGRALLVVLCLNPLTRIHCLPTKAGSLMAGREGILSQSPDEDSLSSDRIRQRASGVGRDPESQSPDEDSLSSDENPRRR